MNFEKLAIAKTISRVVSYFKKKAHQREWTYGHAGPNMSRARRNRKGEVQFVMWKAGEHGHTEDRWLAMNTYWWPSFQPDKPSQLSDTK